MASHPFVLLVSSFVAKHFFSGMLSVSVNLPQHFIFSITKQIIYATNKQTKNHLRLSGGSLVLFSEVNLNLHVFRPLCNTTFTEQDIKKNICPVTIFSPFMHMFSLSSLSRLYCTHSKNDLNSKHSPSYNFFLLICLK